MLEILGIFFSGSSVCISLLAYLSKTTRMQYLIDIRDQLGKQHYINRKTKVKDEYLHWMSCAELISPWITRKMKTRLYLVFGYVFFAGFVILTDADTALGVGNVGAGMFEYIMASSEVLVALIASNLFFNDGEKLFLKNASSLEMYFYKINVLPAIDRFNDGCADLDPKIYSNWDFNVIRHD